VPLFKTIGTYLPRCVFPNGASFRERRVNKGYDATRGKRPRDLSAEIPIVKCHACADIADRAFESTPDTLQEVSVLFLKHVLENHPGELMNVLAERYGPIFLAKREMR
jgi:hypothetical protein